MDDHAADGGGAIAFRNGGQDLEHLFVLLVAIRQAELEDVYVIHWRLPTGAHMLRR